MKLLKTDLYQNQKMEHKLLINNVNVLWMKAVSCIKERCRFVFYKIC